MGLRSFFFLPSTPPPLFLSPPPPLPLSSRFSPTSRSPLCAALPTSRLLASPAYVRVARRASPPAAAAPATAEDGVATEEDLSRFVGMRAWEDRSPRPASHGQR